MTKWELTKWEDTSHTDIYIHSMEITLLTPMSIYSGRLRRAPNVLYVISTYRRYCDNSQKCYYNLQILNGCHVKAF